VGGRGRWVGSSGWTTSRWWEGWGIERNGSGSFVGRSGAGRSPSSPSLVSAQIRPINSKTERLLGVNKRSHKCRRVTGVDLRESPKNWGRSPGVLQNNTDCPHQSPGSISGSPRGRSPGAPKNNTDCPHQFPGSISGSPRGRSPGAPNNFTEMFILGG
jgi:hypothetical protein